jgi:glycosyltransferase involved in cell wall biosynthesis
MRIGVDARPLVAQERAGVSNYLLSLLQQLPKLAPQHEYILYSHREINGVLPERCIRRQVDGTFGFIPGSVWLLSRVGQLIRHDKLDAFWSTAAVLPLWVPKDVLRIITVYDLVWFHFPQTMRRRNLWVHRMRAKGAVRNCDRLIAISQSTAQDVVRHFHVPAERVRLVYPGISARYKLQDSRRAAEYISRRYGVSPSYMATVGTIEPRKNLTLLIRALQLLKQRGQLACPLLVAGANGWRNSSLFKEFQDSGLSEQDVRFLGYLPDDDLPAFYAGAKLFVFPSLYEGFGIPPVEAMACGTPVVASNAQPMPETLGDAAILASPYSAQEFADAITQLLTDEHLYQNLRERGLSRARCFREECSARQFLQALSPA